MSLTRVRVPPGFGPTVPARLVRNGLPAHVAAARGVADNLNFLLGRCGQIIPGKEAFGGTIRSSASDLALWRRRYRATPNGTTLVCEVHLIPTPTTAGTPRFYVKVDGVSAGDHTHNVRCDLGAGDTLDDIFVERFEIPVSGGAAHNLELWTDDNCRVVGWYLWEKPRTDGLLVGTDTVADPSTFLALNGITAQAVKKLIDGAEAVWKWHRGAAAWSCDDPASPFTTSSTTPTNIWESGNAVAMRRPTQYRNSYRDEHTGNNRISAEVWCYAARTAGGGGTSMTVRFTNGAGGTSDITVNGAAGFYTASAASLLVAGASVDTITCKAFVSGGGVTGEVYDVGFYPIYS